MAEEFKPEEKTEEDEKWLSRRVDGDVNLEDVDDLSSWIRTKMAERNEQIEQEDEEAKKARLAERKRKVLSYQEQQKVLLKELAEMNKKGVGEGKQKNYPPPLVLTGEGGYNTRKVVTYNTRKMVTYNN